MHFTKNILHTGCLVYPVVPSCFSKELISWSVGKDYAQLRYDGVAAGSRGWNEHILIDDGKYLFTVISKRGNAIITKCRSQNCILKSNKSFHIPNLDITFNCISVKFYF